MFDRIFPSVRDLRLPHQLSGHDGQARRCQQGMEDSRAWSLVGEARPLRRRRSRAIEEHTRSTNVCPIDDF